MRTLLSTLILILLVSTSSHALEIKNQKVTTSGGLITIAYDLFGKPGEKSAAIKVAIVIDGERYRPGSINLVGDYGSNVAVGKNKKITWNLIKDMPAGYTGTITVEMDAEAEAAADPFNLLGSKGKSKPPIVTDVSVADPKSKLVWLRSPLSIKPVNTLDAAVALIGRMNQQQYAGFSDWRLPKKDEYETLLKMLETYGYKSGQSALPYLSKVGFDITRESRFWTIDKSSLEVIGRSVSVYGSGQYGGSATGTRSSSTTYGSSANKYSRSSGGNVSSSGAVNFAAKATATAESVYDGMDCLFIDTKDGYFYKHNGSDSVYVFAVRGDSSTELYGISMPVEININP